MRAKVIEVLAAVVAVMTGALLVTLTRGDTRRRRPATTPDVREWSPTSAGVELCEGFSWVRTMSQAPAIAVVEEVAGTPGAFALCVGRLGDDGRVLATATAAETPGCAWAHDGAAVLWTHHGVQRLDLRGGPPRVLVSLASDERIEPMLWVDPGGERIAYVIGPRSDGPFRGILRIHDLPGDRVTALALGTRRNSRLVAADVSWSLDRVVAVVDDLEPNEVWQIRLDGSDRLHVQNLRTGESVGVSCDGDVVFGAGWGGHTTLWEHGTGTWRRLSTWMSGPRWSPDGRTLAGLGPEPALWLYDMPSQRATKVARRATPSSGASIPPVWSSDGRFVAFWFTRAEPLLPDVMGVADLQTREVWLTTAPIRALAFAGPTPA